MTTRQTRFLRAAFAAAPTDGRVFFIEEVGRSIGYTKDEAVDIFRLLAADERSLMMRIADPSGESRQAAILTRYGREDARQLNDDERAARRERFWKFGGWALAAAWTAVTIIVLPLVKGQIERRLERLEQHQHNATTQP